MTTAPLPSPEIKLMSKPRSTTNSASQDGKSIPDQLQTIPLPPQAAKQGSSHPRRSSMPSPSKPYAQQPSNSKIPDSVIDSALLAALRDPRERIGLLRLEQSLIDFVEKQPQDPHLEVGGPYNSIVVSPTLGLVSQGANSYPNKSQTSFQRCILHRLADRFQISRENNGNGTIRLLRQPQTKIPSRLLLDVRPREYSLIESTQQLSIVDGKPPNANKGLLSSTANGNTNAPTKMEHRNSSRGRINTNSTIANTGKSRPSDSSSTSTRTKNPKMRIMKRADSNPMSGETGSRSQSNSINKKKASSLTDREKAYAEARARIFQRETPPHQSITGDPREEPSNFVAAKATVPIHHSASNGSIPDADYTSMAASSLFPNPLNADPRNGHKYSGSSSRSNATNEVAVASNLTTSTKATFRDRKQEQSDPDFQRRGQLASTTMQMTSGMDYDYYNDPTKDYYGYYTPPLNYPHHQYQQPCQPISYPYTPNHTIATDPLKGQGYNAQFQLQNHYTHLQQESSNPHLHRVPSTNSRQNFANGGAAADSNAS